MIGSQGNSCRVFLYLAIPVMFGASLLKLLKFGFAFSQRINYTLNGNGCCLCGFGFAIRFLMGYIKKNDFKAFGYYRIVLGVIVVLYFLAVR